jgi:exonuclease III
MAPPYFPLPPPSINNDRSLIDLLSDNSESFAALHCNIRSLSANYDSLVSLLSQLHFPFNIIGITETKIKLNEVKLVNADLPGYCFLSQPSESNAGGVGFYINEKIDFSIRDDITETNSNFEALWIEIDNKSKSNLVCGVIYRHPKSDIDEFMKYLNSTVEKIHRERKCCIMMGDFNIDLLKYNSHQETDDFINALCTLFFHPQILQPTRVTDHSATLIDNIFFNSIEHISISGNIVYDLSDHLPNFLLIKKSISNSHKDKIFTRDYSRFNQETLYSELRDVNWEEILAPSQEPI